MAAEEFVVLLADVDLQIPRVFFRHKFPVVNYATSATASQMQKRFISTSTHILDSANTSITPVRPPAPPELPVHDPNDKQSLFDQLTTVKAKKQEAFEEAYKFSCSPTRIELIKAT